MSRSYYRAFLPIKQERSDYSINGREAVGKAIIEARGGAGKISVTIQDAKPGIILELYMIAGVLKEYIGVNIGKMFVDGQGRGACKHEFDADSVKESGIAIEGFTIAALIAPKEGELVAPFVGYKDEAPAWKVSFKYFTKAEPAKTQANENEPGEAPKLSGAGKYIISDETTDAENSLAENQKIDMNENEAIETEESAAVEKELELPINPHEKFRKIAKRFSEKMEDLKPANTQEDEPINEEIQRLFETNTVMHPFQQRKSDVTWIRISPKNLLKLPAEFSHHASCPLLLNGFRNFKHLILGECRQYGLTKFLLGVPDIYYEHKNQSASDFGFLKFECCDGGEVFNGAYGYWVIVI